MHTLWPTRTVKRSAWPHLWRHWKWQSSCNRVNAMCRHRGWCQHHHCEGKITQGSHTPGLVTSGPQQGSHYSCNAYTHTHITFRKNGWRVHYLLRNELVATRSNHDCPQDWWKRKENQDPNARTCVGRVILSLTLPYPPHPPGDSQKSSDEANTGVGLGNQYHHTHQCVTERSIARVRVHDLNKETTRWLQGNEKQTKSGWPAWFTENSRCHPPIRLWMCFLWMPERKWELRGPWTCNQCLDQTQTISTSSSAHHGQ